MDREKLAVLLQNLPQVVAESEFDQLVRLILLGEIVQGQSFHGESLSVVGKPFENEIGLLDGLFVLFHFIVLDDILEDIRLLFGQGAAGPGLRIVVRGTTSRHDATGLETKGACRTHGHTQGIKT